MITGELSRLSATRCEVAELTDPLDLASIADGTGSGADAANGRDSARPMVGSLTRSINGIEAALAAGDVTTAEQLIGELAMYSGLGRHLTRPWPCVVAAAPTSARAVWSMRWPVFSGASSRKRPERPATS